MKLILSCLLLDILAKVLFSPTSRIEKVSGGIIHITLARLDLLNLLGLA